MLLVGAASLASLPMSLSRSATRMENGNARQSRPGKASQRRSKECDGAGEMATPSLCLSILINRGLFPTLFPALCESEREKKKRNLNQIEHSRLAKIRGADPPWSSGSPGLCDSHSTTQL